MLRSDDGILTTGIKKGFAVRAFDRRFASMLWIGTFLVWAKDQFKLIIELRILYVSHGIYS